MCTEFHLHDGESPVGKEFLEEPKLSHIVFCQANEGCEEDAQAKGK